MDHNADQHREKADSSTQPYGSRPNTDLEDPALESDIAESTWHNHLDAPRPTLFNRISARVIPHVPIFLAFVFGIALTAGTTYALVIHVQHIVSTATVSSDPKVWIQEARTRGYDRCYNGCQGAADSSCASEPGFVAKACAHTAKAGVACDAARMWNWRDGRYPEVCLSAVGEFYRSEALAAERRKRRRQYGLIVLTLLGGVVVGWVTYKLGKRVLARWQTTEPQYTRPVKTRSYWTKQRRQRSHNGGGRLKTVLTSSLALFGRRAEAYACSKYGNEQYQYFVNTNRTIFGVIDGWMSDCYNYSWCTDVCSTSCSTSSSGSTTCSTTCTSVCHTETRVSKYPSHYVSKALDKVLDCGFELSNMTEMDVDMRVANAGIEQNYWVKISVNAYNVTSPDSTDDDIWCLHRIGDTKP